MREVFEFSDTTALRLNYLQVAIWSCWARENRFPLQNWEEIQANFLTDSYG